MITPTYKDTITVGGSKQSIQYKAFPDSMINRQSGDITIIHNNEDGLPFDISSLSGSDFRTVPVESGEVPATLAVGVVGFTPEIFTIFTSGTPDSSGTFIIRVAGEDTAPIPYSADAAAIQAALEALPSRTGGDFLVSIKEKENLSFAGAQILVEAAGGFAIDFDSTIDADLLPNGSIALTVSQKGSSVANEYNANWDKDSIPANYSTYDFDKSGAIAFFIALEDGDDFYQVYQRLNVIDGDFAGQGTALPSDAVFLYTPNDPNAWLRITTASPVSQSEANDKLIAKNFRDFGTVLNIQTAPPGSPADADAYLVAAPATGLWLGLEGKIAKWSSTLAAWAPSNIHREGDEVLNLNDDLLYRVDNLLAWVAQPDPLDRANMTGTQLASTISDIQTTITNNTEVLLNTAKVTNATHTGDATGDTALTLANAAITGKATVTADVTDFVLVSDTSDSGNLKKALVSDLGGAGDVVGPATAINDRIVLFNGTTGKLIEDSGYKIANVLNRGSHTGTQLASTISDFDTAAAKVRKKTEPGTTYTLVDADIGYLIYFTNVAGCTVDLDTGLIDGFQATLIQDTATSVITLAGTATLKAGSDLTTAIDNDAMVILPRPTTDEYTVKV